MGKSLLKIVGAASAAILSPKHKSRLTPLPLFLSILLLTPTLIMADYQTGLNAYANGDFSVAMQEWRAVAEQPPAEVNPYIYAETHYAIARLYWQGQGVPRDYYKAHDWLIKAADLNHAGAMAKLGYLYTDGLTVQQDFDKAFEWYSKAARLGDVDGLYNLGIFYLNGWGCESDVTMAKQYLAAASAQGDQAAEDALQQLMDSEEQLPSVGAASAAIEATGPPEEQLPSVGAASAAIEATGPPEEQLPSVGAASAAIDPPENKSRLTPLPQTVQPLVQNETWILAQNPEHYTIQAIALSDRETLVSLLEGNENLAPYAIYTLSRNNRPLYVLIQGLYPDVEQARATRDNFPRKINRPDRVWIRKFEKIQQLIEAEK